jgi:hypothetical protein
VRRSEIGSVLEPTRGRRVINARAWDCLERCRRKLKLSEVPLPVPVESWIEEPLGIRLGFEDLSGLGPEVLGAAFVTEREIVIDPRGLNHEGRLRFTCAHELGHVMLHRRVRGVFHENSNIGSFISPDRYERQADRFAAAFLMPVPLLERELLRVLKERKLRCSKAVIEMMQDTKESRWLWRTVVLPEIAKRFAVSFTAAVYRFHDVQPKMRYPRPLMPRPFIEPLLKGASGNGSSASIWSETGIASTRVLFSFYEAREEG